MLNYLIIIVAWSAWLLLCLAFSLSHTLAKAFRDPAPAPVPAPAAPPVTADPLPAPSTDVLNYAPVAPPRARLFRRWPWLAGAGVMVGCLLSMFPLWAFVAAWLMTIFFWPYALAAMVVGPVTLILAFFIVRRGLRRVAGVPAAVHWPRGRLKIQSLCMLAAVVLLVFLLDVRTKCHLWDVKDQMFAQSQRLYIPVPAGMPNAADVYARAFRCLDEAQGVADWSGRYSRWTADIPSAPPVLSEPLQAAVPILLEASRLPVADWDLGSWQSTPQLFPFRSHLNKLRLSSYLLHIHAAQQAQAGRIDLAIDDIRALRNMARHAAQGQSQEEGATADGIDVLATRATEDVLPFIRDQRQLDDLPVQETAWYRVQRQRMLQGERAHALRWLAASYLGDAAASGATGGKSGGGGAPGTLSVFRSIFADAEVATCDELFNELARLPAQDPVEAIPKLRQLGADWSARRRQSITSILVAPSPRAVQDAMSVEILSQLQRVGLAARRYVFRTGHFPERLDDLVTAGLLDRVPTDPFRGKPILMDNKGDELVIYAVSLDLTFHNSTGVDLAFRVALRPLWEIDREAYDRDNPTPTSAPALQPTGFQPAR